MGDSGMALEATACAVCGLDDAKPWGEENGYRAVKCRRCGAVYVNPRPRLDLISEAARTGLHLTETGALDVRAKRFGAKVRRYGAVVADAFRGELNRPIRWLDVGAGYGEMVEAVRRLAPPGSEVVGIEPMAAKVRAARAHGLPVAQASLSETREKFDVISLINVFSHIPDFNGFGAELRGHLSPGGRLFMETGNGGDLERRADYPDRLYLPDHLVFVGVDQMRRLLYDMGFELQSSRAMPLSLAARTKNLAKTAIDGRWKLRAAISSPFRTVFYKARLRA